MYKLVSFANFSGQEDALLVPVFAIPDRNVPFVQVMDRNYTVVSLVPYYFLEGAVTFDVSEEVKIDVGSKGIIAFVLDSEDFVYGDIEFTRQWFRRNVISLEEKPLLKSQLVRMTKLSIGEKYEVLTAAAAKLFPRSERDKLSDAGKLWLQGELILLQKEAHIWNSIERLEDLEKTESKWIDPLSDSENIDKENLIRWLSSVGNFENPHWGKAWFFAESLTGGIAADERLFAIALRWLQYLVGAGGAHIPRAAAVLNRILQFSRKPILSFDLKKESSGGGQRETSRTVEDPETNDLNELLLETFDDGTIFNRDLGITESNIISAFSQVSETLSVTELISLLQKILSQYNVYEGELVFFTTKLSEVFKSFVEQLRDYSSEAIGSIVASLDETFLANKNVSRFYDNKSVISAWKGIIQLRQRLADRFALKALNPELLPPQWRRVVRKSRRGGVRNRKARSRKSVFKKRTTRRAG